MKHVLSLKTKTRTNVWKIASHKKDKIKKNYIICPFPWLFNKKVQSGELKNVHNTYGTKLMTQDIPEQCDFFQQDLISSSKNIGSFISIRNFLLRMQGNWLFLKTTVDKTFNNALLWSKHCCDERTAKICQ
jgi:hypothetical protein